MEQTLVDLLRETISIAPVASKDVAGNLTWGTPVVYACRVEMKTTLVMTPKGYQLVPQGRVFIDGNPTITTKDQVTLADGTKVILGAVDFVADELGQPYYTRLEFIA